MVPISSFDNQKGESSCREDSKQAEVITDGFQSIQDRKHLIQPRQAGMDVNK